MNFVTPSALPTLVALAAALAGVDASKCNPRPPASSLSASTTKGAYATSPVPGSYTPSASTKSTTSQSNHASSSLTTTIASLSGGTTTTGATGSSSTASSISAATDTSNTYSLSSSSSSSSSLSLASSATSLSGSLSSTISTTESSTTLSETATSSSASSESQSSTSTGTESLASSSTISESVASSLTVSASTSETAATTFNTADYTFYEVTLPIVFTSTAASALPITSTYSLEVTPTGTPPCVIDVDTVTTETLRLADNAGNRFVPKNGGIGVLEESDFPGFGHTEDPTGQLAKDNEAYYDSIKYHLESVGPNTFDLATTVRGQKAYVAYSKSTGKVSTVAASSNGSSGDTVTRIFSFTCEGRLVIYAPDRTAMTWKVGEDGISTVVVPGRPDKSKEILFTTDKAPTGSNSVTSGTRRRSPNHAMLDLTRRMSPYTDGAYPRVPSVPANMHAKRRAGATDMTANGCGSGSTSSWIPQLEFGQCCDNHDYCYANCASGPAEHCAQSNLIYCYQGQFENCNVAFYNCMQDTVCAKYSWWSSPIKRGACKFSATFYAAVVSTFLGGNAFKDTTARQCGAYCQDGSPYCGGNSAILATAVPAGLCVLQATAFKEKWWFCLLAKAYKGMIADKTRSDLDTISEDGFSAPPWYKNGNGAITFKPEPVFESDSGKAAKILALERRAMTLGQTITLCPSASYELTFVGVVMSIGSIDVYLKGSGDISMQLLSKPLSGLLYSGGPAHPYVGFGPVPFTAPASAETFITMDLQIVLSGNRIRPGLAWIDNRRWSFTDLPSALVMKVAKLQEASFGRKLSPRRSTTSSTDLFDEKMLRYSRIDIYEGTTANSFTYDHRIEKIEGPVRSPVHKLDTAGSVVGSVTTSESPVLYAKYYI
ncbi:hypothetical protein Micbo1qcDRAFT_180409 [Microdochium bolleyi]|uniref:Uncharacterized protein n=1 Tax=Microdochium bolleyi TaxID=196109 RepID=A0A136ILM7_9PEZI|nr:hypothetical protein Micbo1qcDRAFT_180409 [Microdochium bolleyi]